MYWLCKLVLYRMDDKDVEKHLDAMTVIYERLNALIIPSNSLSANDIFATALLISVPSTWLHSISHLLNSPKTSSAEIVSCLKAESNRRASLVYDPFPSVSESRAFSDQSRQSKGGARDHRPPRSQYDAEAYCKFCKTSGQT